MQLGVSHHTLFSQTDLYCPYKHLTSWTCLNVMAFDTFGNAPTFTQIPTDHQQIVYFASPCPPLSVSISALPMQSVLTDEGKYSNRKSITSCLYTDTVISLTGIPHSYQYSSVLVNSSIF